MWIIHFIFLLIFITDYYIIILFILREFSFLVNVITLYLHINIDFF
jgi:hypothetical protein